MKVSLNEAAKYRITTNNNFLVKFRRMDVNIFNQSFPAKSLSYDRVNVKGTELNAGPNFRFKFPTFEEDYPDSIDIEFVESDKAKINEGIREFVKKTDLKIGRSFSVSTIHSKLPIIDITTFDGENNKIMSDSFFVFPSKGLILSLDQTFGILESSITLEVYGRDK